MLYNVKSIPINFSIIFFKVKLKKKDEKKLGKKYKVKEKKLTFKIIMSKVISFIYLEVLQTLTENNSNTLRCAAVKFLTLTLFLSRGQIKKTV